MIEQGPEGYRNSAKGKITVQLEQIVLESNLFCYCDGWEGGKARFSYRYAHRFEVKKLRVFPSKGFFFIYEIEEILYQGRTVVG